MSFSYKGLNWNQKGTHIFLVPQTQNIMPIHNKGIYKNFLHGKYVEW